ncbi:MAG: hypothetical protein NC828_03895, partial [Candidatus Omnitrophica bacterium]|nr:hypothetical protein [Candidatus Omnitrophota bacterium]
MIKILKPQPFKFLVGMLAIILLPQQIILAHTDSLKQRAFEKNINRYLSWHRVQNGEIRLRLPCEIAPGVLTRKPVLKSTDGKRSAVGRAVILELGDVMVELWSGEGARNYDYGKCPAYSTIATRYGKCYHERESKTLNEIITEPDEGTFLVASSGSEQNWQLPNEFLIINDQLLAKSVDIHILKEVLLIQPSSLRARAFAERGSQDARGIFSEDGRIDIVAFQRFLDEVFADLRADNSQIPADARPVLIGSAVYLADVDGRVDPGLIEDFDIVFEGRPSTFLGEKVRSLDRREIRRMFAYRLRDRFSQIMGANNTSPVSRGWALYEVEIESFAFYEFEIKRPNGAKIIISLPPLLNKDIAQFILDDIFSTMDEIKTHIKDSNHIWIVKNYGGHYNKLTKRFLRMFFFLTVHTGQISEFFQLRAEYIETIQQAEGDKNAASYKFLVNRILPAIARLG